MSSDEQAIRENCLILPDGRSVEFPYTISRVAKAHDVYIVLLDLPAGVVMTENVFGVSESGDIVWQIERIPTTATTPANRYTGIVGHTENTAVVFNCNGFDVRVDLHTGKVLDTEFVK